MSFVSAASPLAYYLLILTPAGVGNNKILLIKDRQENYLVRIAASGICEVHFSLYNLVSVLMVFCCTHFLNP